jgi:hypothetical protein
LVLQAWTASGGVLARRPAILSVQGKSLPPPVRWDPKPGLAAVCAERGLLPAALLTSAPTVDSRQPVTHSTKQPLDVADPRLVSTASVVWNRLLEKWLPAQSFSVERHSVTGRQLVQPAMVAVSEQRRAAQGQIVNLPALAVTGD